jgi:diamine N-acetyltransferase
VSIITRFATAADAAPLRQLSEDSFRAAYTWFNTEEDMTYYVQTSFSLEKIQAELADPALKFLLAVDEEEIVGYVKLSFHTALETNAKNPAEIARLYTRVDLIGKGIGKLLVQEAARFAAANNFDGLCLSVWQQNPKGVKFYQREGFEIVGTTTFLLGKDVQDDFVMLKKT